MIQGLILVSLVTLIGFWKRKEPRPASEPERIIPLPNLPASTLEVSHSLSLEAVNRARETLKVLKLERQILGSAVTTIYESQTRGVISQTERDRLLEKYNVDLKRLETAIDADQRVVDLYDLESERVELIKTYTARLAEIEAKLKDLRSGTSLETQNSMKQASRKAEHAEESKSGEDGKEQANQDPQMKEKEDEQITDAEKRIEKIRAEILQAMDRLEQIETDG